MDESTGSLEPQVEVKSAPEPTKPVVAPPVPKPEKTVPEPKVEAKKQEIVKPIPQYRLNAFTTAGIVKSSISSAVYQDACRKHGDIMRCISSSKWTTFEEILNDVWTLEKKMKNPSNRTRKAVETALNDLIERELVSVR